MDEDLFSEEEIFHADKEGYLNIINTRNVETKLGIAPKSSIKSRLRSTEFRKRI